MSKPLCSTGLRWLWLVVVVLIIDLGSKYLILQNFALGDTVSLFPSLNLHYARNYGAAFSFLADSGWLATLVLCRYRHRYLRYSDGDDVSLEGDAEAK
ncbi:lipoprotein signal peptidase [Citrobacter freundii]|nr:lipoprotein signal peptidase [Citrobacter freundii]